MKKNDSPWDRENRQTHRITIEKVQGLEEDRYRCNQKLDRN
jgi:hypothetical protein